MSTFRLFYLLTLALLTTWLRADDAAILSKIKEGKTAEAAALLQTELDTQKSASPEVFYNLGYAQAISDKPGAAFLSFDRALLLNPQFSEARQNVRTLEKIGSKRFEFQSGLWDQVARGLKLRTWKTAFWWATWAAVIGLAGLCVKLTKRRWPWVVLSSVAAGLALGTGLGWHTRGRLVDPSEISIVQEKDTEARNAPANTAAVVISLPAGSQVRPLQTVNDWAYVEIPGENATRGWVPQSALAKLWPWAAYLVE